MSDERKTCEEWHQQLEKGIINVDIRHILWDWQNDRVKLEVTATRLRELLDELNELYKDGGTIAEWAVLFDKVEKELADD